MTCIGASKMLVVTRPQKPQALGGVCGTASPVSSAGQCAVLTCAVIGRSWQVPSCLQTSVKVIFVRGSVIRYVHIPKDAVDTELLQDAATKEATVKR